jgi:glutathione synthase/RimK-type ligase-like ATP-grasp enzyme
VTKSPRAAPDAATLRVALATAGIHPRGYEEDDLASAVGATWAAWDDPSVDWSAFDLVVVRSTWDYLDRAGEFLAWARRVPRLENAAPVLAWNVDKRYLADLAADGVPTVPTRWIAPGTGIDPRDPLLRSEHVVKPAVSAGARDTGRFSQRDAAGRDALLERIHASGRTAMVQPFVASVEERGESALVLFEGRLSHAVEKGNALERGAPPREEMTLPPAIRPHEATPQERALAERVTASVRRRFGAVPLYARVDLVDGGDGPLLLEAELVEPFLFLRHAEGAALRLADAIRRRAAARADRRD